MFKKAPLYFSILVLLFASFTKVFAYDDKTTHPALTQEIIEFYNSQNPQKPLTPEEKEWVIKGSILEDTPPRWINHFYDPVYKAGWTGEHAGALEKEKVQEFSKIFVFPAPPVSSLNWLHSNQAQAEYGLYGGVHTWDYGILKMVEGNEKEGYETLGYILHLIEDASVPEHTRNDTHAHEAAKVTGDYGSPYEEYLTKYNRESIKKLNIVDNLKKENLRPAPKPTIDDYLISLAEYSNKYFFSKDTINDPKYSNPKIVREDGNFGYGMDEFGREFPLVAVDDKKVEDGRVYKLYSILSKEEYYPILDAYFSRLSRQVVLSGAGVIELFRKEAELKKEYPQQAEVYDPSSFNYFELPALSFIGELYKIQNTAQPVFLKVAWIWSATAQLTGKFFSGVFREGNNFEPAGQVALDNGVFSGQSTNNAGATSKNTGLVLSRRTSVSPNNKSGRNQEVKGAKVQPGPKTDTAEPPQDLADDNQNPDFTKEPKIKDEIVSAKPQETNFEPASPAAAIKECRFATTQSPSRERMIINEVAWMGGVQSASDEWIELKNISSGNIELNNWQLLDKGEKIKINLGSMYRTRVGAGEFLLLERTNDNSVPNVAADLIYTGALANTNEGLRLFDSNCNLVDEILTSSDWPAGEAASKKTMERDKSNFGWHTSAAAGGTPKRENSEPAVYNGGGGASAAVNANTNNQEQPAKILITEVQITGGPGKTDNDFIELYNPNSSAVNLRGYRLVKRTKIGTSDTNIKSWTADAFIPAGGYYLWAESGYVDIPKSPDATTSATLADDNGAAVRFGPEDTGQIIDSVGWGGAQNAFVEGAPFPINPGAGQSLERKFQNNSFVDSNVNNVDFEIQTCPSPKAQSRDCSASSSNQALSAFFVYAPQSTQAGEAVNFDAASSTHSNPITSYEWRFGDNQLATTTAATSTHTYLSAGSYVIELTIRDSQSATSSATSTIKILEKGAARHIVISEVKAGASDNADNEFVELYNPTSQAINLSGWSLKRKTSAVATSTKNLVSEFGATSTVAAQSFFLIAHKNYSGSIAPDIFYSNNSNPLAYTDDVVILEDESGLKVDEVAYAEIPAGKSLERKANASSTPDSMVSGGDRFLGNSYDTDSSSTDFILRDAPNPQNSLNLPEPREAPAAPADFNIVYGSTTLTLTMNWQPSADASHATSSLTYELSDGSALASFKLGTSTSFIKSINEVSRDYTFSIQAFDRDGLGSASSSKTASAPSLFDKFYFYRTSATSTNNFLEAYYSRYPFVSGRWNILVFYLNSDANKNETMYEAVAPGLEPASPANTLGIKFKRCSGGSVSAGHTLILPAGSNSCGVDGGTMNQALDLSQLEDNHFLVPADNTQTFSSTDYLTIAYLSNSSWSMGAGYGFSVAAVDKTKYYFRDSLPNHEAPVMSGNLNVSFDKANSLLNLSWAGATDKDTIDNALTYEINFSTSTVFSDVDWQAIGGAPSYQKSVSLGDNFTIGLRAKDDFGNLSNVLSASWGYPAE